MCYAKSLLPVEQIGLNHMESVDLQIRALYLPGSEHWALERLWAWRPGHREMNIQMDHPNPNECARLLQQTSQEEKGKEKEKEGRVQATQAMGTDPTTWPNQLGSGTVSI